MSVVARRTFLIDDHSSSSTIFKSISSTDFLDVSYFFIIQVIKGVIVEISFVVFEIIEPALIIRNHLPTALPILAGYSPPVVSVYHHQI